MSWSDEKTLHFLSMYKNRSLLWDPTNPGYKNKNRRHNLLIEIALYFNMDKAEVEKKIRSLQSQFARERKKEKHAECAGGSGKDEPYVSKWFGYKSMLFLVDKHKSKTTTNADGEVAGKHEPNEDTDSNDNQYNQDETELKMSSSPKKFRNEFNFPRKSMAVKRKLYSYSAGGAQPLPQAGLNETLNIMRSIHTKMEDKDEYTLFGEQVAVKLRKLASPQARFTVQNIINKAFFDAEMGMYSGDAVTNTSYIVNTSSSLSRSLSAAQSPVYTDQVIKSEMSEITIDDIEIV